ncbi:hypothetical protein B0H34DRAFT_794269 [Crassisporium funariophilum]|nr:hypothetical protein B0H34DRAFT_794269 [Crassisporium funariophilum]
MVKFSASIIIAMFIAAPALAASSIQYGRDAELVNDLEARGIFGAIAGIGKAIFKGKHHHGEHHEEQKRSQEIDARYLATEEDLISRAEFVDDLEARGIFGAIAGIGKAIFKGKHHHEEQRRSQEIDARYLVTDEDLTARAELVDGLEARGIFGAIAGIGKAIFKGKHHHGEHEEQKRSQDIYERDFADWYDDLD